MSYFSSPVVLLLSLCFLIGPANKAVKKNLAPTPSFRKWSGVSSSTPASGLTTVSALPSAPSQVVDNDISPRGTDLRPRKRRTIDRGAGIPAMVALSEVSPVGEVQDVAATLTEEDVGAAQEVPWLEEADTTASLRSEGNKAIVNASSKVPALLGRE